MQDAYTDLVRKHIAPALKERGLRRRGRTWWEQRPGGGWVLVSLFGDRYNSADLVEFWGEAVCWPPGTWEFRCEFDGRDDALPYVAANAPTNLDSRLPEGGPSRDGWRIVPGVDLDALAEEVLAWFDEALTRARACCDDVDVALEGLVRHPEYGGWGPTYAIAMLRHEAPDHPRLPEIVARKTVAWKADARPITLRPYLVRWRAEAGLPPDDDLPSMWTPSMLPHVVERHGSPQAAYRALGRGRFLNADGTESDRPPAGWLEAEPAPVEDPPATEQARRRWWQRRT